ncbi:lecithin retinol acyltransferase family protein [cf. Phormidesmis sp. LEGE 11477]|uniref:lecithin retinol acyltransferase family protein n=1 Tax=cf. Phormidesmis sp. LEGE 11477 TaxID=1828680 RepID=UPI00187E2B67|nr:lecithin retinol acyltransferase family protein [cf. Phormidesmis sp. LEGE 11477]
MQITKWVLPIFPLDEIVARAQRQIGRHDCNAVVRNCENFANWCVTGRSKLSSAYFCAEGWRHLYSWRFNG